jgi:hypothetical protein
LPNSRPELWSLGLTTLFFKDNFSLNYMITKIDDCKIKHQHNVGMFALDNDNII